MRPGPEPQGYGQPPPPLPKTNMPAFPPGDPGPIAALGAPNVPLFCTLCARRLVPHQEPRQVNAQTGQREHDLQLVCPRLTGPFSWWRGMFHDVWTWEEIPADQPRLRSIRGYGYWYKSEWR